jgi:hypothetical protein
MIKRVGLVLAFIILAAGIAGSEARRPSRGYYNKEFKIGFKYPANWDVVVTNAPIGDETFKSLVMVSPRERALRGRLIEADVTILIANAKLTEAVCNKFTDDAGANLTQPAKKKIGNLTFYEVSSGDVAAGTVEETDTYRTFHAGRCYALALTLHRQNTKQPDQNVRMVSNGFDTIVRTFYFGK